MHRWILLCVVALLWVPASAAQITEETSDITGEYRVSSEEMNDLWIDTYAGNYGAYMARYVSDSTTDTEQWMITLYGFADDETGMARVDNVYLQVDGRQFQPLEVTTRTRQLDNEIMEVVETNYTASIFTRIANASDVRVDVGDAAFQLRNREDMRMIVQTVSSPSSQTASSGDGQ